MPEITQLCRDIYERFIHDNRFATVLFDAPTWNTTYKQTSSDFQSIADKLGQLAAFGFVDVDDPSMVEICRTIPVVNVPLIAYYKDGKLIKGIVGVGQDVAGRIRAVAAGYPIGNDDGYGTRTRIPI
jgi:hypothetical protein